MAKLLRKLPTTKVTRFDGYVAFLDILGFEELLKKPNHADIIGDMISALKEPVERDEKHSTTLKYIAISDSIIVTAESGKGLALVRKVAQVQNALLKKGFASRGAISSGTVLTYNSSIGRNIFGTTYLNAYKGETTLAVYPRVVLENEATATKIRSDVKVSTDRNPSTYIRRDQPDGIWIVNQFFYQAIWRNSVIKSYRNRSEEDRRIFDSRIATAIKENKDDPRAYMKWRWLAAELDDQLPPSAE